MRPYSGHSGLQGYDSFCELDGGPAPTGSEFWRQPLVTTGGQLPARSLGRYLSPGLHKPCINQLHREIKLHGS